MPTNELERKVTIGRPPRLLEGLLGNPSGTPRGGAVVCHPHPQYGGDMHNNVVTAVVRACLEAGLRTLRFNFGGVGGSQGTHSAGEKEVDDVTAAVEMLAAHLSENVPVHLIGYSYGAWVALRAASSAPRIDRVVTIAPPLDFFDWSSLGTLPVPVSIIAADNDPFCPADRLARVLQDESQPVSLATEIPGADHFFFGHEQRVAKACLTALGCA